MPDINVSASASVPPEVTIQFTQMTKAIEVLTSEIRGLREEMGLTYVRKDVYERDLEIARQLNDSQEERLNKHSNNWEWMTRLILGAVLLAILGVGWENISGLVVSHSK